MSLINDALKKAQRARVTEQASADLAQPGQPTPVAKRARAKSANTTVLLGAGALVLVVISVVATVYLLNRPSPAPTATIAKTAPEKTPADPAIPKVEPPAPEPVASAPATNTPTLPSTQPEPTPTAASIPAAITPAPTTPPPLPTVANAPAVAAPAPPQAPATAPSSTASSTAPATSPAATAPIPAPAAPAAAPAKPDERVAAYVDSIRVSATRAAEGRVLMNDRVYRINDVVERTLGLRLSKVAIDSLTFTDANGITYVKYF